MMNGFGLGRFWDKENKGRVEIIRDLPGVKNIFDVPGDRRAHYIPIFLEENRVKTVGARSFVRLEGEHCTFDIKVSDVTIENIMIVLSEGV